MTNPILDILNVKLNYTADEQQNNNKTKTSRTKNLEKRRELYKIKKESNNRSRQQILTILTKEQLTALVTSLNNLRSKSFIYPQKVVGVDNKKYKLILVVKKSSR